MQLRTYNLSTRSLDGPLLFKTGRKIVNTNIQYQLHITFTA